jgi:hypothetical protein
VLTQIHRRLWPASGASVRLPTQPRTASSDPWDGGFRR